MNAQAAQEDWRARLRDEGRREDRAHALALIEEVAHQLGSMFDPFFDGGDEDEAEAHRRVRFGLAGDLLEALALLDEAGEGRR